MAGRTRLFQQAGSPLIQGRSRYQRSFWVQWLLACFVTALGVFVCHAFSTLLDPSRATLNSAAAVAAWLAQSGPGFAAGVVASAAGVWASRWMGWSKPWLVGGLFGAVVGAAAVLYG